MLGRQLQLRLHFQVRTIDDPYSKKAMVLKLQIHFMTIHFSGHTQDYLDFTFIMQ